MSNSRPDSFLPLFVADYLADTTHLRRDEDGAYLLLLMAYWRRGGPLPADDDKLARIAKATPSEWKRIKPVMLEFFNEINGLWVSKRADEEISKATARMEAKSKAGRKGAESRWQTHAPAMPVPLAEGMTKNGSSPSPSLEERKDMSASADVAEEFSQFWKEYPRTKNMSRKDALKAWKSLRQQKALPSLEKVLNAVRSYKNFIATESKKQGKPYPVKHAQGWLNGQRWEGFLEDQIVEAPRRDWGDDDPLWAKFKAGLSAAHWNTWFGGCRMNGTVLLAPSGFVRDQIETRYGKDLERLFGPKFEVRFDAQN